MSGDLRAESAALADEVLHSYARAVQERQFSTAEHLLAALEELARLDPSCVTKLDEAYLLSLKG